ncbi:HdeD family acid-resistance protein [Ileibacterium valens]|uniref:DUF308 domain-containing protein n=1 Tax=Ileibacterium valens TaxID=1862668 RepID=A0A1U7NEJ5_9FIRM|nr:DUF308 domain-containing protein [Ileibacterium valens]OLU38077.1 hypothetical protein BO222_09035 [Ileibacterium valens]OLU39856.1 hypothetical protein BM735_06610 [Erysipelotrichaceae bacterium NYU-BL-F16]OLU43150.1 hypothetical protein BO224_00650 [Erysipelotrichaceae bacterium NYU-BL-E8]
MSKSSFGWAKVLYILLAILYIITGIYFFTSPVLAEYVLGNFIGAMMLVYGVIMIIAYFMSSTFKSIWTLILGILMVVLGIVIFANVFDTMNVLGVIMGIGFICAGAFRIYQGFQVKDMGLSQWWMLLILGILTLIVGCILTFNPSVSGGYFTIWVGSSFLVNGISDLCTALFVF